MGDPHQYLTFAGRGYVDVHDFKRFAWLEGNSGT